MSNTLVETRVEEFHNAPPEVEASPEPEQCNGEECDQVQEENRAEGATEPKEEDKELVEHADSEEKSPEANETCAVASKKRAESPEEAANEKENEKKSSTATKLACTSCGRDSKHSAELIKCQCGKTHQMCRINKWVHCDCGLFTSRCVFCGTANSGTRKCEKCGQRC